MQLVLVGGSISELPNSLSGELEPAKGAPLSSGNFEPVVISVGCSSLPPPMFAADGVDISISGSVGSVTLTMPGEVISLIETDGSVG